MKTPEIYKGLFTGFYNRHRQELREGHESSHNGERVRIVWSQYFGQWLVKYPDHDKRPVSLAAWLSVYDFPLNAMRKV